MIKKFNTHICCLYENLKHSVQNDSWSIFAHTQYVDLLLIHHLKVCSVKTQRNVVANLMTENVSNLNLSQSYKTNNIEDIFKDTDGGITKGKVILIEGAPGIGKTILCKEIAYRWACKDLLQGDKIVLLVFLRDPTIQNMKSVESLVQYMYRSRFDDEVFKISKAYAAYLINTAGVNVTIILDGVDELSHMNEFILDLIYKNILPLSRIVVSSRPVALKVLQQIADVKVEILGFTEENRQTFIKNELKGNSNKLDKLKSYLKENSIIDQLCYIPFILSLLVRIAKEYKELPKSQTEVYSKFIIYTISRFLQKLNSLKHAVSDLDELPLQFKGYFLEICKYAYNALQCDKIVFTANEIKTDFPTFADASGSWSGLGLLKAASFDENNDCVSYNFLHLSIQEYLAAYYITTLNTNQQIVILRNCFFVEKYLKMWIMYSGLSERPLALMHFLSGNNTLIFTLSRLFSMDKISKDIIQSKIKCLYLFQCLSEIKYSKLHDLVSVLFEKGRLNLSNYIMMPKDIDTLIYILDRSATTQWNELNLSHCHISETGCHQLCKALIKTNNVTFDKINLSDNQLTTNSLEIIVDFVVCCKTQVLYLSDDFNSDAAVTHLAMEYAFKDTHHKYPLTIHVYHRKSVVFNKLDKQTIVTHLKSSYGITCVYFINCKIDDEVVTTLTDVITTYQLLCHVCLWNSNTSSIIVHHLLSVIMLQREPKKLLFVYENSSTDLDNFAFNFDTAKYPVFTFIYFNELSFILHSVDDILTTLTICSNPMQFLKTEKLTEVQISNCKINENNIILLSQLFNQCRLRKILLLNNKFDSKLLEQLIASVNLLPSLSEIVIEHNNMAITDCCTIADELSGNQTHSVMLFNKNMLRGYRCHDQQLNESDMDAAISTLLQLCNKGVSVIVYEKNLFTDNDSFIHDAFIDKSIPIAYVFLSKSVLSVENVKKSHLILTLLTSALFCASHHFKIVFSNCDLRSTELIQHFLNLFNQCECLTQFISLNNNLSSQRAKFLFNNLAALSSLRETIIYERNLTVNASHILENNLIEKKQNISVVIMTCDILLGYQCSNELFSYAINLNMMVTTVQLVHCTINQSIFESMRPISCIKRIIINYSKFSELLSDSILSSNNKLQELYLGNNQLRLGATKLATALKNVSSLKVLTLENNNIPVEAADELSAAIRANTSLEKLWLHGNYLGSSTVMIVNALKKVTTLKELILNKNENRSKELAPAIACVSINNRLMEKLGLNNNGLNDDGLIKIAESLCKHTKLKWIDLQKSNITKKSAEALSSVVSNNNGLEELYLGNNQLQLGATKLATAIKNISSLKVLDLQNNNIPEEAADKLSAAIRANNSLEKLWLSGNHLGSSTVMIVNALKEISTLKVLDLNDNKNRSEELAPAVVCILAKNKFMQILGLSNNGLNDDGAIVISESLCKHTKLRAMDFQKNNITKKSSETLSLVISSNNGLEELYLSNNQLQLGAAQVATALKNISSLKTLGLQNNNIPDEAADELSAAIRANISLEKLWLGGNHLESSTVMIVDALKEITTLKELSLGNNGNKSKELAPAIASVVTRNILMEILSLSDSGLNDDGVIEIAESLCKHTTKLKVINLHKNNITEKSAESLSSIISSNTGLEELYLGNNQLQLGAAQVATALKTISSLKVLNLSNNNIPEQAADELSAAIRANNSLEKLWLNGNYLGSSTVVIINALKEISTLKELNLSDNENRNVELGSALTCVLSSNKLMEILSLSNSGLNDDGVTKIAKSLCEHTKLKRIVLHKNNITKKSAEALSSIISSNNGLEELYLGNNQLQLGAAQVASALKTISSLKVLCLENNNIPEEAADELEAAIRANTSLEQLWISDNYLGFSITNILKACCHNYNFKEFSIRNTYTCETVANDLSSFIRYNYSLELLEVSDNNLLSSGFIALAHVLKVTSSLKCLYAFGINVTSTVSGELSSVIDHNELLEELLLGDNLLENGLIQIAESCSRLTSLKILELSHNCINPTQVVNLASIVSKCNSLEALSLGGICLSVDENLYLNVSRIYDKTLAMDIRNLINNREGFHNSFYILSELLRMTAFQVLIPFNYQCLYMMYEYDCIYISYQHKNKFYQSKIDCEILVQKAAQKVPQIDSKAMISSLQIIRTLKVINLENNNIDEDAATELASRLHCNNILEQLWLRGNELHDKGASVVLQSLNNLSTLLILDLSFNHLSNQSADGIAVVIGNNCSLQQLWLDGNYLLTRGVVRIASALKKLSSLRILSLCSNEITDDAAEEISNVITSNALLVDLLLGNNQIQARGICTITIALRKVSMLRTLDLSNNHITPDAAEELAITLSKCTNLQQLFLNDNMLGTKGTIKIANALKCINSLQVLTLSNNNITESAADVLVDVLIKNNISLKIVLIGGNNLQTTGVNLIVQTAKNITTLQLLDVSDNNISEDEKEKFRTIFAKHNNFTIVV